MPKVRGPMFSLEAKGTIKKTLTFQGSQVGGKVNVYKKKVDNQTERQLLVRTLFDEARQRWNASTMAVKNIWNEKARGKPKTGYDLFLSNSIINLRTMDYEKYESLPVTVFKKGAKPPDESICGLFVCFDFGEEAVAGNEEFIFSQFHMSPDHKPGSDIHIILAWFSNGEVVGDVKWEISIVGIEANTDDTVFDSATVQTVISTVNSESQGLTDSSDIIFDGSLFHHHDIVGIKVKRKSSEVEDTMSGDASLILVEIHYISDRLGTKV